MIVAHAVGSAEFWWAVVAELSLVAWTALLFVAVRGRGRRAERWRLRLAGLAAALLAALIAFVGKTVEVWPGNPLFPSGHTAYVVTIAVLLVALDRRWLAAVVPMACLMAVALVAANYHAPVDLAGGTAVGLVVGCPAALAVRRFGVAAPTTT